MLIVKLQGGLGNQMFQYAAGRALSLRTKVPLLLDTSWYTDLAGATPREYLLHVFPVQGSPATAEQLAHFCFPPEKLYQKAVRKLLGQPLPQPKGMIEEPHFHFWTGFRQVNSPAYLVGYWQSEQYFVEYASTIRADFQFPALPAGAAQTVAQAIAESAQPVAVHIRRGDYVENAATNEMHGVCSSAYYASAIVHLKKQNPAVSLFLFSDDPIWVQEHFDTQGLPATFVDLALLAEPWHDMHLISLCRHHIIANSSFSWWGAWLGEKRGTVCAPKQWFANPDWQSFSPCPERWLFF